MPTNPRAKYWKLQDKFISTLHPDLPAKLRIDSPKIFLKKKGSGRNIGMKILGPHLLWIIL